MTASYRHLKCRGRSSHLLKHHQCAVQTVRNLSCYFRKKRDQPFSLVCTTSSGQQNLCDWYHCFLVIYSAVIVFCAIDEVQLYKLVLEHNNKILILFGNISLPYSCWIFRPQPSAIWFINLL